VPWLAGVVLALSAFQFLTAILNSLREIGKLAMLQVVAPVVAAIVAWPLALAVRAGHPLAMILLLAIPAAAAVIGAMAALQGHRDPLREWFEGPGRWWSLDAARGFLGMSGAMLTSGLLATAVLLAVRGFITRREGIVMTGQFDAAWNISMSQVTLILGSVQTYYLPSLAAAKSASERAAQIRNMMTLATLAVVPAIVALAALKPLVVGILYSKAFAASPGLLRWTLLGDYLKVTSWVLAAPLLATREVGAFLGLDLVAHATFFFSVILLARAFQPAESAAIGFAVSYALYLVLCYAYARARHGFRLGRTSVLVWLTGLVLVSGASASAWSDTSVHVERAAVWILLAIGFSAGFFVYIRRHAP
jgi:PST family polysaccharide transporter